MTDRLVFKTGLVKRAVGWTVFLGAASSLTAMIRANVPNWATQSSADRWSLLVLSLLLASLMVLGIAVQYVRWSIEGETITLRHLFRTRSIHVSDLAGFGKTTVIVVLFPLANVDLYDHELKPVLRLPVGLADWPRAERWFAERLRYVVNDGSAALPKRRFVDTPKT